MVVSGQNYCQNDHSPDEKQILMGPHPLEFQIHKLTLGQHGSFGYQPPEQPDVCITFDSPKT